MSRAHNWHLQCIATNSYSCQVTGWSLAHMEHLEDAHEDQSQHGSWSWWLRPGMPIEDNRFQRCKAVEFLGSSMVGLPGRIASFTRVIGNPVWSLQSGNLTPPRCYSKGGSNIVTSRSSNLNMSPGPRRKRRRIEDMHVSDVEPADLLCEVTSCMVYSASSL